MQERSRTFRKLCKAIERRDMDTVTSLVHRVPRIEMEDARKMLERFYKHEVSVANAMLEITAYAKVHSSKVKPPLKGSFYLEISGHRQIDK